MLLLLLLLLLLPHSVQAAYLSELSANPFDSDSTFILRETEESWTTAPQNH
jgi:hypothetical protein